MWIYDFGRQTFLTGSVNDAAGSPKGPSRSEVALVTTFFRPRLIAALAISFFLVAVVGGLLAAALAG